MSILTDVYLSRDEEAVRYDVAPNSFADRTQFTGLTSLEFSTLWSLMRGIPWDVSALDEFPCLLERDGGEVAIYKLASSMLARLADLTFAQVSELAVRWAATDELLCQPDDVRPVLEELVRMARVARETSCQVYVWICV